MTAYKTDGTVVVIGRIIMVMEDDRKSGDKENQYKEDNNACGPSHDTPFIAKDRLIYADKFVNEVA